MKITEIEGNRDKAYINLVKYADARGRYFDYLWDRKKLNKYAKAEGIEFDSEQNIVEED